MFTLAEIVDKGFREDWGGTNPIDDKIIILKIRIRDKVLEVFCCGKWRQMRYWPYRKLPSNKTLQQITAQIELNSGLSFLGKDVKYAWAGVINENERR